MNSLCARLLVLFILIFSISELIYASDWKVYVNKPQGYELHYPPNGVLTMDENIRSKFYLDPLKPIEDLSQDPRFSQITVDSSSLIKITFPDKYLIILSLKKVPPLPPPSSQLKLIGQYSFWQTHTRDAAMCHYYDYYTYYLPHKNKFYVFIFLLTSSCFDQKKSTPVGIKPVQEDLETILRNFKFISE